MCVIPKRKGPDYKAYVKLLHILGMPFGIALLDTKSIFIKYFMLLWVHDKHPQLLSIALLRRFLLVAAALHLLFYFVTVKMNSSITAVNVFTMFRGIRVIATLIIVLNRNTFRYSQVEVATIICRIEKRFLALGIADNYKKKIITTLFLNGTYLLICISISVYANHTSTMLPLWETIDTVYDLTILNVPYLIQADWKHHIISKMDWLKEMLTNIKHYRTESEYKATAIEVLLTTSRNYEDIYRVMADITDMYSFEIGVNLFVDMNQFLILTVIIYQGHGTVKYMLTAFGILVRFVAWLVESKWIKQKSTGLASILGECESCYSSFELSSAKNTFLIQLLHEKVAIDYYGFIQLDASFLLSQFNQAMSLLIFLFEVTNTYLMEG